jgi:hypothetical protein
MSIETKLIDGQVFVIQRQGKREFTRTPAEAIAVIEHDMEALDDDLRRAKRAASVVGLEMQTALLAGLPTNDLRTKLAAANEVSDALVEEMGELREQSREVWVKVDAHQADIIRAADAARLAALVEPAETILKELTQ